MANLTDSVKKLVVACETKNNGSPTLLVAAVDGAGWNQVTWSLMLGILAAGATVAFKIQESADGLTAWIDIAGKALSLVPDTGDSKPYVIEVPRGGATGRLRYQRPVCVVGDGAPGAALCIEAELSAFSSSVADVAYQDLGQRVA
jgi:hypothetical protein